MKLEDLNNYPEYPDVETVEQFCNLVLTEADKVTLGETLSCLCALGDKQWHTYTTVSGNLRDKIKDWLIKSGTVDVTENYESVLLVSFYFSLDKEFYGHVLDRYVGENKWQFENNLKNSTGDYIDPWWSMKKNK